jgi:hypothetical protein
MEIRYWMVGLVPIHVYSDAVEGANARHPVEGAGRQLLESEEIMFSLLRRRIGLQTYLRRTGGICALSAED